ncbi:hypothetical protein K458DRAFT_317449 [Lentithecium fluviatile CBS 122367]|uniref:DUF7907 domain-containing protein n=1 Tax=Lentithecium fluviatile CBS 122367 TaxID=1168545 RepID=A0A6G1IJQ2_9PLEO|nr:hypothetical protein K458DRAFT_317449 [Lentithecium fluviatile CBS 122367]
MKLPFTTLALAFAASTLAQYDNESPPFNLVLLSADEKVNGSTLSACHSGAGISSLCLSNGNSTSAPSPQPVATFHFNTSTIPQPASPGSTPGFLSYDVPTSTTPIPSTLDFFVDPITNFALPLFYPGNEGRTLAFDDQDLLNVQGYVDYGVNPPKSGDWVAYYRWFSCTTYYMAYEYVNVVWGLGVGEPETPDCVKVEVKRVIV